MHILVTGGTGFIGSHCVLELLKSNHTVTVISNLVNSVLDENEEPMSLKRIETFTKKSTNFKKVDLLDQNELEKVFKSETFDAVMHLASLKGVGESCREPLKFYYSNIVGSLNLIKVCEKYKVRNIIFSSSSALYGTPLQYSMKEEAVVAENITNPYGHSKFMIEKMLKDIAESSKNWNIICLRYSNPAGSDPSAIIGEFSKGTPNSLLPYIGQVLSGKLSFLTIFGGDFNTSDGTGVRDYIHVTDVARANLCALNRIIKEKNIGFEVYNIGMGKGYSVLEIVEAMECASGKKIATKIMPPRVGDVPYLCCDPTLAAINLKWTAQFSLEEMCRDVLNWQKKNAHGYVDDKNKNLKHG